MHSSPADELACLDAVMSRVRQLDSKVRLPPNA